MLANLKARGVRTFAAATAGIVVAITLVATAAAQAPSSADQTESRIEAAMAGFHRFQSSHSIEDLRATSYALHAAIDQRAVRTGDVIGHRRSVVAAYAQVLQQIDALADPTVNRSELLTLCVTPPREPNGRQLPACADPNAIPDPATRAQYLAAINAKSAEIKHRNAQAQLSILDDDTTSLLEIVLRRFHTRALPDGPALDDILRRAGLSEARRTKIHAMF